MDSTRAQQGTGRTSARYLAITDEDLLNEGEYDDVWPTRSANSTRRYRADVRTEAGRAADVLGQRRALNPARRNIPPRRTSIPPRVSVDEEYTGSRNTDDYSQPRARGGRRFHWLVPLGLLMLVMIFGWVALSAIGSWWQTTQDDWHYGRPRTFQIDQVVGHHDSSQNPSHFITMNLNRHIVIIEIPGGDVSKSVVFSGPTLLGPGQDLTPVTLTFQDVNHDGKIDMIVTIQGNELVFLNENGTFVTPGQNPRPGS